SSPGRTEWFIARICPSEPSTSSTISCLTTGPSSASGFDGERVATKGSRRRFLFENYLITWEIPGTIPLDEFLEQRLDDYPEPARSRIRRRLASTLAVLTARLHNAGMTHIDFHPGNILVRLREDEQPELTMIDLDALRTSKHLSWASARENLA